MAAAEYPNPNMVSPPLYSSLLPDNMTAESALEHFGVSLTTLNAFATYVYKLLSQLDMISYRALRGHPALEAAPQKAFVNQLPLMVGSLDRPGGQQTFHQWLATVHVSHGKWQGLSPQMLASFVTAVVNAVVAMKPEMQSNGFGPQKYLDILRSKLPALVTLLAKRRVGYGRSALQHPNHAVLTQLRGELTGMMASVAEVQRLAAARDRRFQPRAIRPRANARDDGRVQMVLRPHPGANRVFRRR